MKSRTSNQSAPGETGHMASSRGPRSGLCWVRVTGAPGQRRAHLHVGGDLVASQPRRTSAEAIREVFRLAAEDA